MPHKRAREELGADEEEQRASCRGMEKYRLQESLPKTVTSEGRDRGCGWRGLQGTAEGSEKGRRAGATVPGPSSGDLLRGLQPLPSPV